jgi:DNA topoisomerase I
MGIIQSSTARQILDIIIGFKVSPMLWKHVYHSKSNALSAGRCQTPALGIIYENYKQGLINESQNLYKTIGKFFQHNLSFELSQEFETYNEMKLFLNESIHYKHKFLGTGNKKISVKSSPKPLNTSRMLQLAGGSPKYTMQLAQKLYQEGHITYMRTESTKYSKDFLEKAQKFIIQKFASIGEDGKKWVGDLNKIENTSVSLPHEAIRVTNLNIQFINSGDTKVDSLYHLIWKITIESCMADAIYDSYHLSISAPQNCIYTHVLEIPVFLGWKKVDMKEVVEDGSNIIFYLQSLGKDIDVLYHYIDSTTVLRGKHTHYNETGLIQKLEDLGIGRPSTYAMFVETIQERGYVTKKDVIGKQTQCVDFILRREESIEEKSLEKVFGEEKSKLVIEPLGILCIDFLLTHFSELFAYSYTKNMEDKLDKISITEVGVLGNWYDICADTLVDIESMIKQISKMTKQTYRIDDSHELVFQQHGPCVRHITNHTTPIIEYLPVKKTIELDLERLKKGEYNLEDLVEYKTSYLGDYEGNQLHIHVGQFGPYLEWGVDNTRKSIKNIQKPLGEFTIDDAIQFINQEEEVGEEVSGEKGIVRILDATTSIRRGRFGIYVYYNPPEEKKPQFIGIKTFSDNYMTCDPQLVISWAQSQSILPKKSKRIFTKNKK